MQRFLFRVQYAYPDGRTPIAGVTLSYEPVCIRAETAAAAQSEVEAATARYVAAAGVTRTITLVTTTADV
jgi:hypothetical protein